MSSELPLLTTQNKQLMLVNKGSVTLSRPGGTRFNFYAIPTPYIATGYTPMIMAYYKGLNGDNYVTSETFNAQFAVNAGMGYMVSVYGDGSQIKFTVYGSTADGNTYSVPITYYVFINSALDE